MSNIFKWHFGVTKQVTNWFCKTAHIPITKLQCCRLSHFPVEYKIQFNNLNEKYYILFNLFAETLYVFEVQNKKVISQNVLNMTIYQT